MKGHQCGKVAPPNCGKPKAIVGRGCAMSTDRIQGPEPYFVARCDAVACTDEPILYHGDGPLKSDRAARSHSTRNPTHQTCVIELMTLKVIARYRFEELEEPPF